MAGPRRAQTFAALAKARGLPEPIAKRAPDGARFAAISVPVTVLKSLPEERLVWGWVSVVTKGGATVLDLQGDEMDAETLEKAAHGYLRDSRVGKRQHQGDAAMELVESIVLTKAKQDAMGVDLGHEGWFAGWKVHCDETWEAFKGGEISGFSIGGRGVRTPVKE
jgi:hypothetical protein